MPDCAVARVPAPISRWPATPTCPASTTESPIVVLPAIPTCDTSMTLRPTHPVRNLHEVVDLRARLNPVSNRRPIDCGVGADLHVIFNHHGRVLGNFLVGAVGPGRKAEAVAANHGAVLHDDAVAKLAPLADGDVRVDQAVIADGRPGIDHGMGVNHGAGPDDDTRANEGIRPDVYALTDGGIGGHLSDIRDARRRPDRWGQEGHGVREGEIGIPDEARQQVPPARPLP